MPDKRLTVDAKQALKVEDEVIRRLQAKKTQVDEELPKNALEWAERHRRIDGQPFSLERFKPLRQLYLDDSQTITVIKPAQRGVSEWAINLACYWLDVGWRQYPKDGCNVGYIFPTIEALRDFSKERFGGLGRESKYLEKVFKEAEHDGVQFKSIRNSNLYLRGGWSENSLTSFPADVLILDEYDRIANSAIALATRRLSASVIKYLARLSTPRYPGTGIDHAYSLTDRRIWETRCPTCHEWSELLFHRDVRADGQPYTEWQFWPDTILATAKMTVACPACQGATDPCGPGRWRATVPEALTRGYKIPALAFPMVDLNQFAVAAVSHDPDEVREFHNSDLGEAFQPAGTRITADMLLRLASELPNGELPPDARWSQHVLGVDVGSVLHYWVTAIWHGEEYVRAVGHTDWEGLDLLMAEYKVRSCVIDNFPEQAKVAEFQAKFPGRVLRALYPNEGALQGETYRLPEKRGVRTGIVQINRTRGLDTFYARVAEGAFHLPMRYARDPNVVGQLTALQRTESKNDQGQAMAEWIHTRPDHLNHAAAYATVARLSMPRVLFGGAASGVGTGWKVTA